MTRLARVSARLMPAVAAVLVASCGGGGPKLHPVRGKVLYLDQPAEGAIVVFQPANSTADSPMPSGTVGADGTFTLRTHPHGEGAPAGDYVVLVTWLPPNAREMENPPNKLPPKYASLTDSPLKATVKSGSNELEPFRLTK
ncbi:MAG TPA: hypothetical protein VKD90_22300 [Gemmataceae bacterium]|nr:hypothetical protein [Gemmataceae bacterium]